MPQFQESLAYTITACALGSMLLATSTSGVVALLFGDTPEAVYRECAQRCAKSHSRLQETPLTQEIQAVLRQLDNPDSPAELPMDMRGTHFQQKVWTLLRDIPSGTTSTYQALSIQLNTHPRAIAKACASNSIGLLIPCHRVLNAHHKLAGYRWGIHRKAWLLAQEQTRQSQR